MSDRGTDLISCGVFVVTVCSQGSYTAYWKHCLWSQTMEPYIQVLPFKQQICRYIPVDENDMALDEVLYKDS